MDELDLTGEEDLNETVDLIMDVDNVINNDNDTNYIIVTLTKWKMKI